MSDSELRKFFTFDETDLNANRSGKLSAKQKTKLETSEKGADQIFVGAGIFFIIIALVIVYFVAGDSILKLFSGTFNSSDILTIALGAGLPILFFGFFAYGAFKMGISKLDNTVLSVQGKINFVKVEKQVPTSTSEISNYRTVQQYELRVGKIAF